MESIKGKYTMIWMSPVGIMVTHLNINKLELKPFAQFKNALIMHYTEKGKRTNKAVRYAENYIKYNEKYFFCGWIDPNSVSSLNEVEQLADFIYKDSHTGFVFKNKIKNIVNLQK